MDLIYRILISALISIFMYGLGVLGLTIYKNTAKTEVVELNTKEALQASAYRSYTLKTYFDLSNLQGRQRGCIHPCDECPRAC